MSSPWLSSYLSVLNSCIYVGILTGWNFWKKNLCMKRCSIKKKRYRWHLGWNFTILCQVGWPHNETAKLHANMGSLSTFGESLLHLLAYLRRWGWVGVVGIRSQGPTYLRTERLFLQSWLPAGWYQGYSLCKVISHITLLLQSGLWRSVLSFKKKSRILNRHKKMIPLPNLLDLCCFLTVAGSSPFYVLFYVPDIFFFLDDYY